MGDRSDDARADADLTRLAPEPRQAVPGSAASDNTGFLEQHGAVLALGILGLGVLLRLAGLTGWWLNPDEGIYYSILTHEHFSGFWAETATTAHPPLYFLLLRGMASLTTDFLWLRSPALLSGCAAVYVFFLVGRELGGTGSRGWLTGLLSALALALSPQAIIQSQVIRPYMLLAVLLAGALYALLRYLRMPSTRLLVAYTICVCLAVLLHYSAVFGLGVFACLVFADAAQRGHARPEWRRLLVVQAIPGLILAGLYFVHLRHLLNRAATEDPLGGWLGPWMIQSPGDAWVGTVGFQSLVVGEAYAASAALITLFAFGYAAWSRAWTPLLVGVPAFLIAVAGAVLQVYPFGATRHGSWLLVFVVPVAAWSIAVMFTSGRRAQVFSLTLFAGLAVGGGRLGSLLGADGSPQGNDEHVLRTTHVAAMAEALDPLAEPKRVFMSAETYIMLSPLYALERQSARMSQDEMLLHFVWGSRDVFVLRSWEFVSRPDQVDLPHHLYTATQKALEDFPEVPPSDGEPILLLEGGWSYGGISDLIALAGIYGSLGTTISVPGLIALTLDLDAYARVLGEASRPRSPPEEPQPSGPVGTALN